MNTPTYFVGLDLGQARDYTALAVLERRPIDDGRMTIDESHLDTNNRHSSINNRQSYHCRHLERLPLGTLYPQVVERVQVLLSTPPLCDGCTLCVDATGVGKPVVDMLIQAGLPVCAVTITGGDTVSHAGAGDHWRVPKRELVSTLQVLLQSERLKFAQSLPLAHTLVQELLTFQVKLTMPANEIFGTWREGAHDDLVLALALAAWKAESFTAWVVV